MSASKSLSAALHLIEADELPDYPIRKDQRLQTHYFVEWHFARWINSDFRLLATDDVVRFGRDLFDLAQMQAPVGTLPTDDRILAKLLGIDLSRWQELNRRDIPPLYNWYLVNCEGEARWAHKVVTEMAVKALKLRADGQAKREAERERKRDASIRAKIVEAGGRQQMADSVQYRAAVNNWLRLHYGDASATMSRVQEAMNALA